MPAMAKTASRSSKPAAAPKSKSAAAKQKAASTGAAHPPYFEMIKEAITALKDRTGSSPHAIAKYMEDKYGASLPANYKKMLSIQLRGFAAKGKLFKVKASYKLSDVAKKGSPKAKPAATKSVPKPAKSAAAKPKKSTAAKPKKSTAAKPKKSTAAKPKKSTATKPKTAAAGSKRKAPEKKVVAKPKKSTAAKSSASKKARKVAA